MLGRHLLYWAGEPVFPRYKEEAAQPGNLTEPVPHGLLLSSLHRNNTEVVALLDRGKLSVWKTAGLYL